ncbi:alpha/beta hydrolase [Rhizobium sp. BK251]|uniref:alpha/beta fold hydrolase n=1 Tax=Rhizobium sp. BK251 TaxID=2512125 RepID=UPI001051ED70|nr:alpha/beta hydrolase [Rhizobium sp. BK251]TCL65712.1 sigma-B regulation protein RsbQ [Rhizobium sp. BK251]
MSALIRNNVKVSGAGDRTILFAHGFGCDQAMWRFVAPHFEKAFKVATMDHVGAGGSDLGAYDAEKYASLDGYASDIIDLGRELGIRNGIFVGHSVSAMIGVLASIKAPEIFGTLIMVGPSPRYIDDGDYVGGFGATDIDELLASFVDNPLAWSAAMAPAIMGNADRPELGQELTQSFCRTDPQIALQFARATFTSDNRADLPRVTARTLILQCRDDIIAGEHVGAYVRDHVAGSTLVLLDATGHCPNLSAPAQVTRAIMDFV